jgi:hypothetical protein
MQNGISMLFLWPARLRSTFAPTIMFALGRAMFAFDSPARVGRCVPTHRHVECAKRVDALLATRSWPRGSEIIVPQINIAPMFELIEHHDFKLLGIG